MSSPPLEQSPIPCQCCGGSMRESGPSRLVGPVRITCPYCGTSELLPEHQAQRVMALRARLAQLRAAQEAADGPLLACARIIQMLRGSYGWMIGGIFVFVIASTVISSAGQIDDVLSKTDLPAETRSELLGYATTYPSISIGIFLGAAMSYVLALLDFKKAVEPRLRAKAPLEPGSPARCRSCGGALPRGAITSAFVQCSHCSANNLVTGELVANRIRYLEEETRGYQEMAAGTVARAQAASSSFQKYFYVGVGAGAILAIAFASAAHLLIATIYL